MLFDIQYPESFDVFSGASPSFVVGKENGVNVWYIAVCGWRTDITLPDRGFGQHVLKWYAPTTQVVYVNTTVTQGRGELRWQAGGLWLCSTEDTQATSKRGRMKYRLVGQLVPTNNFTPV